ncbi:MAG: ROK family protein [Oscillospiraceae bacterium]|nr:ROK family protein [Clostridia bacterium]MBQ9168179.1 ROK family protein [Oscillospiraceae bacterium]
MVYIGIDVGGTGIQMGVVDDKGQIIAKGSIVTRTDIPFEEQVKAMADCALETLEKSGHTLIELASIGIGIPGIADQKTGVVPFCTNLGWKNVPLRETFQKYIDKPILIDNDATVAGLAESVAGVSAGTDSSVFLTLGTGVGAGIVIRGKVWSGFHGVGSEVGHMIMEIDGEPCSCGNRGCLERYTSATAIIRMAREAVAKHPDSLIMSLCGGDPSLINAKMVFDAAREGDEQGLKVFRRYTRYLGQAIATIINFFDPEVIVLGGGVSKAGKFLLDAVREEAPKYCIFKSMPISRIEIAELGPDAGIIGAAMLGL